MFNVCLCAGVEDDESSYEVIYEEEEEESDFDDDMEVWNSIDSNTFFFSVDIVGIS